MGFFSGSTKTKTTEKSNTGPSEFQAPYLTQTFDAAKSIYDTAKTDPYYTGPTYASMDAQSKATMERLKAYSSGQGLDTAVTLGNLGSNLVGSYDKAASAADRFTAMAGEDATGANIASAQRYADNPYLDAQIDANSRDVTRNLSENILPGIDRAASASGNINSSRAGVASGIAQRGAADRIADISATMRGDAYNRGLTLAQGDRASTMGALSGAASIYNGMGAAGVNAMGAGTDAAYGAFDASNRANEAERLDRQGMYDADFKRWQGEDTRDMDLLARYASVVAGNQWGQSGTSEGTSKTKSSGSIVGQLAGLASTAASIYTGLKVPKGG